MYVCMYVCMYIYMDGYSICMHSCINVHENTFTHNTQVIKAKKKYFLATYGRKRKKLSHQWICQLHTRECMRRAIKSCLCIYAYMCAWSRQLTQGDGTHEGTE